MRIACWASERPACVKPVDHECLLYVLREHDGVSVRGVCVQKLTLSKASGCIQLLDWCNSKCAQVVK